MTKRLTFDEIVHLEAQTIARGILERRLDDQNLPLPKESALAKHLDQIIAANPQILEDAKIRVIAQKDAASGAFASIGGRAITGKNVVDIDL